MNVRREHFAAAARARLGDAKVLQDDDGGRTQGACYLAHVAVECALKLRVLSMVGATSVEEFRRKQGNQLADSVFSGARGHDLAYLADRASLDRLLVATSSAGRPDRASWTYLSTSERAYGLRYGVDHPPTTLSRKVVQVAKDLVDVLLKEVPS